LEDQVERLSVSGPETYAIRRAVQKHRIQQVASFRGIPRNVKKIRSVREFKNPLHVEHGSAVIGMLKLDNAASWYRRRVQRSLRQ